MGPALENGPLTVALVEKARNELRETPELSKEAVAKLQELLRADKTLHYPYDEEFLIRYLRPSHFYPESALKFLRKGAEFKEKYRDVTNIDLEELCDMFQTCPNFNILVDRDQDGRRILLLKLGGGWDTNKFNSDTMFKFIFLACMGATLEPATQINGSVVILDFKDMGMKQVAALGPSVSIRLLTFIQEVMPLRLKQVHIVNEPMIFNLVWQVFKPLIGDKLRKRIFFHKSKMESLHKHINPDNLPADYKGKLPEISYTAKDWYPTFYEHSNYIKDFNEYGLVKK